jgi:hypothetical protein
MVAEEATGRALGERNDKVSRRHFLYQMAYLGFGIQINYYKWCGRGKQ